LIPGNISGILYKKILDLLYLEQMFDPNKITYFAETDSRNKRTPFGIKAKDRLKHVYVIGKTGMGKSTLLENMAVQDIKGMEGMAFIDPHGKTADLLLEYVPPERVKDVVYFAPFDTEFPISFNVMEDVGEDKRHLVANGLMSAFKKIWVDAWSARMEYILNNILLALLEYPDSTLIGVNRMLADKSYRLKVVANITDPSVKAFWVDEFEKYGEKYMQEAGAAIQNKIGQFIANPLVRNLIGQPKSTFDIRKIMDEGKIMIINLSKGRVGEANANLIGSMLITKIYLAAMSRADKTEAELNKLPNFYLYVDEFQNFANESFADILSEARKYKLNLTVAHQYIEQMSDEVRAAVFGNVGTMISFRVGSYDAEVLEKEFAPIFIAEDLVNLGFTQIYLKLMIDGIGSQPFSASTLGPIAKPETSSMQAIIDNSRQMFARPRAIVEKEIADWHEQGREEPKAPRAPKSFDAPRPDQRETRDRREPKPIDIRGRRDNDTREARPEPRVYKERTPERREERQIQKETISTLPQDDFKPLTAVSLDDLKKKSDNQRKPSPQNVSDLRKVLSSMVKPATTQATPPKPRQETPKPKEQSEPKAEIKKEGPKEIPEDALKELLGVE
jgi:hypothetical protein